ncbi:MAG: type II toxin-antitoxin system HicB family antitoxin [Sulfuriferula sp.]|jgi:predicted RNase H-like HicB family nuclease|nr:type II toxin-antitoxin system HicB family antitoxin [Sulfuriferula sp.]
MQFPIAIHKDEGSVYGVIVPDILGCHSWGDTIDDAIKNAKDAIFDHLELLLESGEKVDIHYSRIEDLRKLEDYKEATWALVEVDLSKLDVKPERVNISMPRFILSRIDDYVAAKHETRSGFLARAALNEMAHEQ